VVVSGTDIRRPCGLRRAQSGAVPTYGPTQALDVEVEVGFVVGVGSTLGEPVPIDDFRDHVFGLCLLNDWSARDIQAFETAPLGPFLGKSFATSVSPWLVPLAALSAAWVPAPAHEQPTAAHLTETRPGGLDLSLQLDLNGQPLSRPPFAQMYWTAAQQLAHLTGNGASLRTGDLYASGTVSGAEPEQRGSFLELSWGGQRPIELADGTSRGYLRDGDQVTVSGWAAGPDGTRASLGEVVGTVLPAG